MSNTPSLLPCPFCGAPAHGYAIAPHSHSPAVLRLVPELPDHPGRYVIEGQCACGSGLIGANESEVTARWNRRTPQQEEPVAYVHVPHYTVEGKVRPVVSFEKYQQDYDDGIYSTRIPLYTAPQPAPDCHHRPHAMSAQP